LEVHLSEACEGVMKKLDIILKTLVINKDKRVVGEIEPFYTFQSALRDRLSLHRLMKYILV